MSSRKSRSVMSLNLTALSRHKRQPSSRILVTKSIMHNFRNNYLLKNDLIATYRYERFITIHLQRHYREAQGVRR